MALPNSNSGAGHIPSIDALIDRSRALGYVMDRSLGTAIYLLVRLGKPLLIEGHAGVGKTEAAKVLASLLGTELLPLQCYEGLDVNSSGQESKYPEHLPSIQVRRRTHC